MPRRSLIGFIVLNVIVTLLVTSAVILISDRARQASAVPPQVTELPVIITATFDPNQAANVTVVTVVVTATSGSANTTPNANHTTVAIAGTVPTLDPSLLPSSLGTVDTVTLSPTDKSGCPTYVMKSGDSPSKIAQDQKIPLEDLMRANNLTEQSARNLKVGQTLIIPVQGCGLPTRAPTTTPTKFIVPTLPSTVTAVPTASEALLEVIQVHDPGIYASESLELHNTSGSDINLGGWTIKDSQGHTYTFPRTLLAKDRRITINTRTGTNTAFALFWNNPTALWSTSDQQITIADAKGNVKLKYSLPADATPGAPSSMIGAPVPTPTPTLQATVS